MRKASWYFLLPVLFFAGDRLGGYWLETQVQQSQFRYSRLYQDKAAADMLLLGNSRGLAFYQPYIEQVTGKSTCNLSYNGLPMDAARALVLDYFDRYPAPQTLLIDITICDRENDALLAGFLCYSGKSARLDSLIQLKLPKIWWGGKLSALFRYNNEIFQRALYYRNKPDKDWLLDRKIPDALLQQASTNSYDLEVNPYLIQQLQATVAKAQEKGLRVVLVISPYFPGFQVKNLDALKSAAMKATGLPVHDYRAALGKASEFGDFMHPNKDGCTAFINIMLRDGLFD